MPQTRSSRSGSGNQDEETRIGWRMAGIGFEVAAEVAAGALLGYLFDRWLGTAPTGLLVGSIAGIAVGLWSLIKGSLKLSRELDRRFPVNIPRKDLSRDDAWDDSGGDSGADADTDSSKETDTNRDWVNELSDLEDEVELRLELDDEKPGPSRDEDR